MTEATLWSGGRVFTGHGYVEALLVENGRVLFTGPMDGACRLAPTGTEHRTLDGALVIPGLVDAHIHLADLTRVREGFDLSPTRSTSELRDRLAGWIAEHPAGPVVGRGWDPERWTDRHWPSLRDIDAIVPDRPTVLYHASGHAALLNSAALAASGVLNDASVPASMVGRFSDGSPNGLLYEHAVRRAGSIALDGAAPDGPALARTLAALVAHGITAVGTMSASRPEIGRLRELGAAGRLPLTVRAYLRIGELASVPPAELGAVDGVSVIGVKGFLDGAFGPRTASLSAPYADEPSTFGIPVGGPELLDQLAEARRQNLAPALHAIGDEAVARAAQLLEPWAEAPGPPARIEHAALTPPEVLAPLLRARPMLVVQPGFVWSDRWLPDRLGSSRCRWAYAFRTLIDRGLVLAGSSDAPYDPFDPWRGIRAAVERRSPVGGSANPDASEALAPEEALGLFTDHAADALGLPTHGRLEPGGAADLLVLGAPDLPRAIRSPHPPVRETWVGGRRAYVASEAAGQ